MLLPKTKKERQVLLSFVSPPGGGQLAPDPGYKIVAYALTQNLSSTLECRQPISTGGSLLQYSLILLLVCRFSCPAQTASFSHDLRPSHPVPFPGCVPL